jgi:DNA replication and repair protein RecF
MYIKNIYLENFRNYEKQLIELNENINVFFGNNAQGKTNILEALYFCAIGRSFRTYKDIELINIKNDESKIKVQYFKNNRDNEIEVVLSKNSKKNIKLNKIKLSKNSELVGNINIVIFSPDDIIILKQSPSLRRKFIDILISQLRPKYLYDLTEYNKIMDQRNAELKNKKLDTIDIWNEQLAIYAEKIYNSRNEYINKLYEKIKLIQPKITNDKENIRITYKTEFENKEQFIGLLKSSNNLDLLRGYTSHGPHREDFEIYINDKELNIYGSQGQHRTALLALKIAELQIIEEEIGETPILLLDDVTSELDIERINLIFDNIKKYQVLITCTDINSILRFESLTKNIKLYNISEGRVI